MIPRRNIVAGSVLGGLGALIPSDADATAAVPAAGQATPDASDQMVGRIVQAITELRAEVQNLKSFGDLAPVRDAQLTYLRANGKFPDVMEVGGTFIGIPYDNR